MEFLASRNGTCPPRRFGTRDQGGCCWKNAFCGLAVRTIYMFLGPFFEDTYFSGFPGKSVLPERVGIQCPRHHQCYAICIQVQVVVTWMNHEASSYLHTRTCSCMLCVCQYVTQLYKLYTMYIICTNMYEYHLISVCITFLWFQCVYI